MTKFNVGDRIRVIEIADPSGTIYYDSVYCNKEGIILKVDEGDDTARVKLDNDDYPHWFYWIGLELVRKVEVPIEYCSCDGEEKTVVIMFNPVRVCKVCKKEKSND